MIISGTTLESTSSIFTSFLLTFATFFPIVSSIEIFPKVIVALLVLASQPTLPPNASIIALIGTSVLPFLIIGGESNFFSLPSTVNLVDPTVKIIFFVK